MPDPDASNHKFGQLDDSSDDSSVTISNDEQQVLDQVAEDLARLGRSKRVGLGVQEKVEFIKVWTRTRTIW